MTIALSHIDHPVIAVRNMEQSHALYGRLGFTIPPRGCHLEWGTGNWCIMFPDDYLELRGIVDGTRYTHNLDQFLDQHGEGLMGLAFAPALSAEASFERAKAEGLRPTGLKHLTRRFELPDGDAFPRFHIASLNEADVPELLTTVVCEHLTPEIIRKPIWFDHANGTTGVALVTGVTTDLPLLHDRMVPLVGEDALTLSSDRLLVSFPKGADLEFLTPDAARREGKMVEEASSPSLSCLTLTVADVERTKATLRGNGVPYTESEAGTVQVSHREACGVTVFFRQA